MAASKTNPTARSYKFDEARTDEFVDLYNSSATLPEIAAVFGVSAHTVHRWATALHLPARYRTRTNIGRTVLPSLYEKAVALTGGEWVTDDHGIKRWVPDADKTAG